MNSLMPIQGSRIGIGFATYSTIISHSFMDRFHMSHDFILAWKFFWTLRATIFHFFVDFSDMFLHIWILAEYKDAAIYWWSCKTVSLVSTKFFHIWFQLMFLLCLYFCKSAAIWIHSSFNAIPRQKNMPNSIAFFTLCIQKLSLESNNLKLNLHNFKPFY